MRFKEFLSETKIADLATIVDLIKKDCRPFLNARGEDFMFRGMTLFKISGTEITSLDINSPHSFPHPTGRKPKDSGNSKFFNFMFNAGCELAFGVEDIRTRSIFGTGDYEQSLEYGTTFLMFPRGEFKFVASDTIKDSYESIDLILSSLYNGDISGKTYRQLSQNLIDLVNVTTASEWVKKPGIVTQSGDEEYNENLCKALKKTYEKYYTNKDFKTHLRAGNEILIYESSGYYSIPVKTIVEEINRSEDEQHHVEKDEIGKITDYLTKLLK